MKQAQQENSIPSPELAQSLETCKTIFDRNRGCITPAEEAIVDLVLTYQATSSLTVDDIEFAHREFVGSVELMKAARPVPAA